MKEPHILKIEYCDKLITPNAEGTFYTENGESSIKILKKKGHKDTLIHELSHFCLALITGHWYGHGAKFKRIYEALKSL